jgi:hypothetical protein
MRRRHYLGTLAAVTLAGCTAGYAGDAARGGDDGEGLGPTAPSDVSLPVPESDIATVLGTDAIPAITDPAFDEDWSGVSFDAHHDVVGEYTARPRLGQTDAVVGVVRDGEARAYPRRLLDWHEVVNDDFEGPLLVTYCPLCGSAVVAERRVAGEETVFGVSGKLWRNDLVMYDEATGSLWSQLLATAIRGPRTGDRLELVPATLATWPEWKAEHPDTKVLRPPPDSNTVDGRDEVRNYDESPYLGYENTDDIGLGGEFDDDRLDPKAWVFGIEHGGVARAYPYERVTAEGGVVNDTVGGLPVVVAVTGEESMAGYARRVGGEAVKFEPAEGARASAAGSRWDLSGGVALDGPHEGTTLRPATAVPQLFFFAWLEFNPDTEVYGEG